MPDGNGVVNAQRHQHMMKIQCVVNEVMGRKVFSNESITRLEEYRKNNPRQTLAEFLQQGIAC